MSNIYEIIETIDGDIVLRRAGDDEESPLVSISFSEEAAYFMEKNKLVVAKAMIEAGLMAASDEHVVRIEDAADQDGRQESDQDTQSELEASLLSSKGKTLH